MCEFEMDLKKSSKGVRLQVEKINFHCTFKF